MSEAEEIDEQRAAMRERWEAAAAGWGRRAHAVRDSGMAVSTWLIDHVALQPGYRVLELAAGPGDTGFLAAELVEPGGLVISSDGAEAMLEIARERAHQMGVNNVEFRRLELEWIDLPTADVDAILCRWGVMLTLDPATALHECRRVLRPGGRIALAVWGQPEHNPWATITTDALVSLGHEELPTRTSSGPGMFALAAPGQLEEMLAEAGFTGVVADAVELPREYVSAQSYVDETLDLSRAFASAIAGLSDDERDRVVDKIAELSAPFSLKNGGLRLPGQSLVAAAEA
jgi:2-polyprenyl-3-methyl-5-hydroxy-6-metoxy-1,4-benzoquinol methylase